MDIDGLQFHLHEEGTGPPLLFLHGFTGSVEGWKPLISALRNDYRCIGVDIVGHGFSESPDDPSRYEMPHAVQDLLTLLDKLDIERTLVLGYSMGGRLALHLATTAPHRVQALILESASPGLADVEERRLRQNQDNGLADRIEAQGIPWFVDYWESQPIFASQSRLEPGVRDRLRDERLQNHPRGLANSLRGMGTGKQGPLWHKLHRVKIPVLLVTGELDPKFNTIAAEMAGRLPAAERQVVAGAGHNVHLEEPASFLQIAGDFLRRCSEHV